MKTMSTKVIIATLPVVALAAIIAIPAISDAQNFGTVALSSGFSPDPRMMSGTSGGGVSASAFGGGCRGFVTQQPDHHMVLNSSFNWLRIFVRSDGDTTLIVRGPMPSMATRCNDDRFGLNPAVEGSWAPGEYHIWVGSYSQAQMYDYQIGFTEMNSVH